ncbi:MAG: RHS repeat-associated core domain-containing protein, partial [Thermoflexales bacterium]
PITTVYIGGSVEVQISGTLRLTTTYYFFGGARIAMRVGETVTYLHGDRLGSASLATDAAGNVLSQERYYVWGSASMMSGTMPTDFQWQNQRRLDETQTGKLYDFNARFFTPVAARFISPDSIVPNPANPQSLNRYTAVANNPLRFTDPTGHAQISEAYESRGGACLGGNTYTGGGGSSGDGSSGGGSSGGSNGSSGGILPKPAKPKPAGSGYNVTGWLVNSMNLKQNLPIAQTTMALNKAQCNILMGCFTKALALVPFYMLVRNGAPWDIKIEMELQLGPSVVIGAKWFEYSTPGNIAYGFLGAALGASKVEIYGGAGVAQARDFATGCSGKSPCEVRPLYSPPTSRSGSPRGPYSPAIFPLGDTVDDALAVRLGYDLYGATGGKATASALTVAIVGRAHVMDRVSGYGPAEDAIDISSSPLDRFQPR